MAHDQQQSAGRTAPTSPEAPHPVHAGTQASAPPSPIPSRTGRRTSTAHAPSAGSGGSNRPNQKRRSPPHPSARTPHGRVRAAGLIAPRGKRRSSVEPRVDEPCHPPAAQTSADHYRPAGVASLHVGLRASDVYDVDRQIVERGVPRVHGRLMRPGCRGDPRVLDLGAPTRAPCRCDQFRKCRRDFSIDRQRDVSRLNRLKCAKPDSPHGVSARHVDAQLKLGKRDHRDGRLLR